MIKVGITGGIGSGKSTVCRIFECLGVPVFRSDEEARRLLKDDVEVIYKVKNLFGEDVIVNGKPDRKKIAALVFTNPEKLAQLNSIIHPAVRRSFDAWVEKCECIPLGQNAGYIINEAAILFETGFYKQLDKMILVTAPEPLRIKRVMKRDGTDEASLKARIKNQWSDEEKMKLTDYNVINDDKTSIISQVMEVHSLILRSVLPGTLAV